MKRFPLVELDARLVRHESRNGHERAVSVDTLGEAQGVRFLCPHHFRLNGGEVGTHSVLVWFAGRGVPDSARPLPRWDMHGSGLADLSISPSIDLGPCDWHGWVTNGVAQ